MRGRSGTRTARGIIVSADARGHAALPSRPLRQDDRHMLPSLPFDFRRALPVAGRRSAMKMLHVYVAKYSYIYDNTHPIISHYLPC